MIRRNRTILLVVCALVALFLFLPEKTQDTPSRPLKNVIRPLETNHQGKGTVLIRGVEASYNRLEMKDSVKTNISTSQLPEDGKLVALRFQKRIKTMKNQCPNWESSPYKNNWIINKHFLVHYNRRILVCAVPKAGSTTWHMMIWAMRQKEAGKSTNVSLYTYEDTKENHGMVTKLNKQLGLNLITYHKGDDDMLRDPPTEKSHRILLTRHPFARLISGWHQKFLPISPYADLMIQRYPKLKDYIREDDPDHRISWRDFAEYTADIGDDYRDLDYHFMPTCTLCKPCLYAYSYILKAESIDRDEHWLKKRINVRDIEMGRKGVPPGGSIVNDGPSDNIRKHMSQLSDRIRRKLYKVYEEDFKMFGYTFNFTTLESGGFD